MGYMLVIDGESLSATASRLEAEPRYLKFHATVAVRTGKEEPTVSAGDIRCFTGHDIPPGTQYYQITPILTACAEDLGNIPTRDQLENKYLCNPFPNSPSPYRNVNMVPVADH